MAHIFFKRDNASDPVHFQEHIEILQPIWSVFIVATANHEPEKQVRKYIVAPSTYRIAK